MIHHLVEKRLLSGTPFFGIEVAPYTNLRNSADLNFQDFYSQSAGLPLFASITWMATVNVHADPILDAPSIKLARTIQTVPVMLHITCGDLKTDVLEQILMGTDISNIVALRGGDIFYIIIIILQYVKLSRTFFLQTMSPQHNPCDKHPIWFVAYANIDLKYPSPLLPILKFIRMQNPQPLIYSVLSKKPHAEPI